MSIRKPNVFLQHLPYACGHVEWICQKLAWWPLWKCKITSFKMTHICPKMFLISIDITHSTHVLYKEAIQMGPKLLSIHGIDAVIMRHMRPTYDISMIFGRLYVKFQIILTYASNHSMLHFSFSNQCGSLWKRKTIFVKFDKVVEHQM